MAAELMEEALARDQAAAALRPAGGRLAGTAGGRHDMSVDLGAFLGAVESEGHDILTPAGAAFWEDQKRRFPHLGPAAVGASRSGRFNRFGRVSQRYAHRGGRLVRIF